MLSGIGLVFHTYDTRLLSNKAVIAIPRIPVGERHNPLPSRHRKGGMCRWTAHPCLSHKTRDFLSDSNVFRWLTTFAWIPGQRNLHVLERTN